MSLILNCCECEKEISRGTVGTLPLEKKDMNDDYFFLGKGIGYTGLWSNSNMEVDEKYRQPVICGTCIKEKLPEVAKTFYKED